MLRKVQTTDTKGNNHPTVKPTELMAYLLRLVTPVAGTALDPFMGSGSTGKAAMLEGFAFIGIEQDAAYMAIAKARIEHALAKSQKQQAEQQLQQQQLNLFSA
jgi:site-specific DNA-methyltransferase (adenine-specific)